ncbi:OmpA family protein [Paralimibaculum aggregatum]|uniref:OmpA family protein n=1 Tax=Paralimibaculum aggregatum TaxID=3036245 RepID=A0ABQ6LLF4_9RHOB|nr:OmpA family protein [Limibaculum sp. NKW23]GMG83817.1 OmpA family protein [Limibaculum sp. NKW23]
MKVLLRIAGLLIVAGCASQPPAPKPGLGAFDRRLAEEYEMRRASEFEERDFADSRRFRDKRDAALTGARPAPDDLSERILPEPLRRMLEAERERLVAVLQTTAILLAPDALAEAQSAFDCWVQEVEEQLQPDQIAACRAAFSDRLGAAEQVAGTPVVILLPSDDDAEIVVRSDGRESVLGRPFDGVAGEGENLGAAVSFEEAAVNDVLSDSLRAEPKPQRSYLIYFETGGSSPETITEESRERLEAALLDAGDTVAARVTVFGHTDRVGSARINVRLARARAEQIRALLLEAGVPPETITADSFGETLPLVPTEDGVDEALNRRVEIAVR